MHGLQPVVTWFIVFVVVSYAGMPIVIRFAQKMRAHPHLNELDLTTLPPGIGDYLTRTAGALTADGFAEPTYLAMPDQVPNVSAYLIMLVNRASGDKAMVTALFAQNVATPPTLYVEFSTRHENGQVFDTLNSQTVGSFPPGPQTVRTQTPSVQDPHRLLQVHRFVMDRAAVAGPKSLYAPGEAVPYLGRVLIESYEAQVKRRWLYLDRAADAYRPTWVGAYRMTWPQLWPVKSLLTGRMRREEQAVLRSFEAAATAAHHAPTG